MTHRGGVVGGVRTPGGTAPLVDLRGFDDERGTPSHRNHLEQIMARITDDVLSMDADGVHFDAAQLVDPAIGGTHGVIIVHIDRARWALPRGARISPGKGVLYVMAESGRVHVLVAHKGAVRELVVSLGFAARVRRERFDRA